MSATMNSHAIYPPLDLPPVKTSELKRGLQVQTRYFYASSTPGSQARVVRYWDVPGGVLVRCNFGKNLSGDSLLKTMLLDALALA